MPRYQVLFVKEKTHWFDEDRSGWCQFNAPNDNEAKAFIATIIERMNRAYERIQNPRKVSCDQLYRLTPKGYSDTKERIEIGEGVGRLEGFSHIRKALEAFYPKKKSGRRDCLMHMFTEWRPIPRK